MVYRPGWLNTLHMESMSMFPAQEIGLSTWLSKYVAHEVYVCFQLCLCFQLGKWVYRYRWLITLHMESVSMFPAQITSLLTWLNMLYMDTVSMFPAQEMGLSTRLTMKAYILHEVYVYISAKKLGLSTWLTKHIVHGVNVCLQLRKWVYRPDWQSTLYMESKSVSTLGNESIDLDD